MAVTNPVIIFPFVSGVCVPHHQHDLGVGQRNRLYLLLHHILSRVRDDRGHTGSKVIIGLWRHLASCLFLEKGRRRLLFSLNIWRHTSRLVIIMQGIQFPSIITFADDRKYSVATNHVTLDQSKHMESLRNCTFIQWNHSFWKAITCLFPILAEETKENTWAQT